MWALLRALQRNWSQHFISQFTTFVILMLSYAAVIFVILFTTNLKTLVSQWAEVQHITLYLNPQAKAQSIVKLESDLRSHKQVATLEMITSEKAAQLFQHHFQKVSKKSFEPKQFENLFPQSLRLKLKNNSMSTQQLKALADEFKDLSSDITKVSYGESWRSSYFQMQRVLNAVSTLVLIGFLVGTLVVGGSLIQSILFQRKEEIEVLEFIGATEEFIIRPILFNILTLCLLSGFFAILFSYLASIAFAEFLIFENGVQNISSWHFLSPLQLIGLMIIFWGTMMIYSYWSSRKFLPGYHRSIGSGDTVL